MSVKTKKNSAKIAALTMGILATVLIFACVFFGSMGLSQMECEAKTEGMGFANRWTFFGGCQVEVSVGQWIPLENYYFKQE